MSNHATPLRLEIPRKLESPNTWQGRHWTVKNRLRQEWEQELSVATCNPLESNVSRMIRVAAQRMRTECLKEHRTVQVERRVPKRQFIRDDDNLRFSVKPLCDALKRLGLIYDDRREYLTLEIVQVEAPTASTVITIQ